jgi:hypothetical protein
MNTEHFSLAIIFAAFLVVLALLGNLFTPRS